MKQLTRYNFFSAAVVVFDVDITSKV